jgi:hypothetical protein
MAISSIKNKTSGRKLLVGNVFWGDGTNRALWAGGENNSSIKQNVIQWFQMSTSGTAYDFGDLTVARASLASCASSTRAVFSGGTSSSVYGSNDGTIDYVGFSGRQNAVNFGTMSISRTLHFSHSSSTRGIFAGGYSGAASPSGTVQGNIEYITIASTGNGTSFGSLVTSRHQAGGSGSTTRAVFGGGDNGSPGYSATNQNQIDYITIASTGNATSFGIIISAARGVASCSSNTRALFFGGITSSGASTTIQYITIASTGNAVTFGDLSSGNYGGNATSNNIYGYIGFARVINYVTIASLGNTTSFLTLPDTTNPYPASATSSAHGGL